MGKTLEELAALVGGEVLGDPSLEVEGISSLDLAGPKDITFLVHSRYAKLLQASRAGAVIVSDPGLGGGLPMLLVRDPYLAYAQVARLLHPTVHSSHGVDPRAVVHPKAVLGRDVSIYPMVFVDRGARIADRSILFPGVSVGERCEIGEDCLLYPGVVLYPGSRLGNRVIIHGGTVIGSDGFGYARDGHRSVKIPQLGTVQIDDDVEIGANCAIDRASFGMTWIQRGVKIDNLVQIAHNVVVGEDSIVVAQVGMAGSVKTGRGVILAGQVGVAGHLRIGDGAIVGPQSGVGKDVPEGAVVSGAPAIDHRRWLRASQIIPRLPEIFKRLRELEKKLEALESAEKA